MSTRSITEIVKAAFSNTETLIQPDTIRFDPKKHVKLAHLPAIASPTVQYLHCAENKANLQHLRYGKDFERIYGITQKDEERQVKLLEAGEKMVFHSNQEDTLQSLKTGLILEEYPLGFRYKGGVIIVEGWIIVGRLKDEMGEIMADISTVLDNATPRHA